MILYLFLLILIGRLILDYLKLYAESTSRQPWRPKGVVLLFAEPIWTITEPILARLRRIFKPLRLGNVSLDLSFMVLFLIVLILIRVVGALTT
ncbi:YggT family protein [Actinocorallia sp. A-T 12471]|uniref:YggT family protein n=1 Tax=Actinocorallia sp. A-T 12471 TaxID=3089813 RepID=UPI0029D20284|nr:YggT family protein [Actinocorallia sp. A-T 12471]MDX6743065.1 YggT family protein [Actinocorallia sp. A-T 12471]